MEVTVGRMNNKNIEEMILELWGNIKWSNISIIEIL